LDDERPDGVQQFDTHSGHAVEPAKTAKWTVFGAPSDDALGQRGTDTGQPCDFNHVRVIKIDPLTGKERARELRGAARRLTQSARPWIGGRLQSHVTGWLAWRGRQHESNSRASEGQARQ